MVDSVPARLARQCRTLTLVAGVGTGTTLALAGMRDAVDVAWGGWLWSAAAFTVSDAALTVLGPVWLLGVAQQRLRGRHRWDPWLSRSAYGAFMLQTPFLLGSAVALRPLGWPAEAKAVLVAFASVTCSYAAAWLLISRLPGVSRIL